MAIYDKNGVQLSSVYDKDGESLGTVYDAYGNPIGIVPTPEPPDVPVTPLTWDMSDNYKEQITDAIDYIKAYKQANNSAFALCQFNDVHARISGNEPNFIDYNKGYKVIDYMLFLGDIVDAGYTTQFNYATSFMNGASASNKLVSMGNHEWYYLQENAGNPEDIYRTIINVDCTYKEDDALIYYHDDMYRNTRFISLDYFHITQSSADSGHLLDMSQLNWLASTLGSSGSKDIVLLGHSMLSPFLGLESGQTLNSSATIQNYQQLINVINAYKQRTTFSVTVDGTTYTHDFSSCRGKFIMYTCGHYHALGYADFGFNMFTGPTLQTPYGGSHKGFVFYIIDRAKKTIEVIQCSSELSESIKFNYTY